MRSALCCSLPHTRAADLQATATQVMAADAHGSSARTASTRRRTGATGPLFVTADEEQALQQLRQRHGGLDAPLPGTLGLSASN
jgi:hypothetical protein